MLQDKHVYHDGIFLTTYPHDPYNNEQRMKLQTVPRDNNDSTTTITEKSFCTATGWGLEININRIAHQNFNIHYLLPKVFSYNTFPRNQLTYINGEQNSGRRKAFQQYDLLHPYLSSVEASFIINMIKSTKIMPVYIEIYSYI